MTVVSFENSDLEPGINNWGISSRNPRYASWFVKPHSPEIYLHTPFGVWEGLIWARVEADEYDEEELSAEYFHVSGWRVPRWRLWFVASDLVKRVSAGPTMLVSFINVNGVDITKNSVKVSKKRRFRHGYQPRGE